jgi:hypothetical protein
MSDTRNGMQSKALAVVGLLATALTLNAAPANGQAQTNTSNHRMRFNNEAVVVQGQTFRVTGGVHVLLHSTADAAGGCHIKGHANPQGLSVRGPTGNTYRAAGAANFTLQSTSGQSGTRFHGVLNLNLIGKGKAEDIKLHMRMRTEPAMAPSTCDASRIARLVLEELGVTLPPGTLP